MSNNVPISESGIEKLINEKRTIEAKLEETQKKDRGGTTSWGGSFEKERLQNELYLLHERLQEIDGLIKNAEIIGSNNQRDSIGFGTKATLLINKEEIVYTFLGEAESDPSKNIISISSPLGKALFGKKEGTVVNVDLPAGKFNVSILEINE